MSKYKYSTYFHFNSLAEKNFQPPFDNYFLMCISFLYIFQNLLCMQCSHCYSFTSISLFVDFESVINIWNFEFQMKLYLCINRLSFFFTYLLKKYLKYLRKMNCILLGYLLSKSIYIIFFSWNSYSNYSFFGPVIHKYMHAIKFCK